MKISIFLRRITCDVCNFAKTASGPILKSLAIFVAKRVFASANKRVALLPPVRW